MMMKKTINTEIFMKLLFSLDDEYSKVRKVACAVFLRQIYSLVNIR